VPTIGERTSCRPSSIFSTGVTAVAGGAEGATAAGGARGAAIVDA